MGDHFIGVDIGTQGARVVLLDDTGEVKWSGEEGFQLSESNREEQSPLMWWEVCVRLLRELSSSVNRNVLDEIRSIGVTSTSGTMIPLDADNEPLHPAIMYSDKRSAGHAAKVTSAAKEKHGSGYTNFNYSSGLTKMVWFIETYPEKAERISKWIHAADFITGKLSGVWAVTDHTNALKSGYDVSAFTWPSYIWTELPVSKASLPEVHPSGTIIAGLAPETAKLTGLPASAKVAVGITDGCASQVASGAIDPGDWNTTIGTTMVIKGVTLKEILDPQGRVYSHRHPEGYWMPGGASNTGADWVSLEFSGDLDSFNRAAAMIIPSGHIAYPLRQDGERFPMVSPGARGFEPEGLNEAERFTANMEGVAYLERYALEVLEELSGEEVNVVYTAGGGSNSEVWLNIRASVMNKRVIKMKYTSGAVGAAIVGASQSRFNSLQEAARHLTIIEKEVLPSDRLVEHYESGYHKFISELKTRGYI